MAASIVSENQYRLPEADRQKIISKSDNPSGKISLKALSIISKMMLEHLKKHGNPFENTLKNACFYMASE